MDPHVELARLTVQHYARHHRPPGAIPPEIREALAGLCAATFVSLHGSDGELRGCKGTLEPRHDSLEAEIISNAISACSRDTRFPPVRPEEVEDLVVHVDVLSPLEPVQSLAELDVKRYGVLVSTPDGRRGVLLPDLDTVDTVEEQVAIAARKGGIHPGRETFTLQRFTTTRHT